MEEQRSLAKNIASNINKCLQGVSGAEKNEWHKSLQRLCWVSFERTVGRAPAVESLNDVVGMSKQLSPSDASWRFIDELTELRKKHPGFPKLELDCGEGLLKEFNDLNQMEMRKRDSDIVNALHMKYVGVDCDYKPEFLAREFTTETEAEEFVRVYEDVKNDTAVIRTDGGYVAVSYDKEDIPPFLVLMTLNLAGYKIDDKNSQAVKRECIKWEEQTGYDYWEEAVRLSRNVFAEEPGMLERRSVGRYMAENVRRDDPDMNIHL